MSIENEQSPEETVAGAESTATPTTEEAATESAETVEAAPEVEQAPRTIPYERLQEVIAQRERERLRAEQLEEQLRYQQHQLNEIQQRLAPQPEAAPQPWEKYQDPQIRAWMQAQAETTQAVMAPITEKLKELERVSQFVEQSEADRFWTTNSVTPDLQRRAEELYTQLRSKGANRDIALTIALGEKARADARAGSAQATASVTQQAQQNVTARGVVSKPTPVGAQRGPSTPTNQSAADMLRALERRNDTSRD